MISFSDFHIGHLEISSNQIINYREIERDSEKKLQCFEKVSFWRSEVFLVIML